MEMRQIIEQAERNIRQALEDYGKHTRQTEVLDNVTDTFIEKLARDSSYAKQNLRELFSKSPVWDESIDALVINGTRTHNPDGNKILELGNQILRKAMISNRHENYDKISYILRFFAFPDDTHWQQLGMEALNELAPKAYAPGKKPSRVFKALCKELGVADETAGSDFQRLYAQFADELSAKKIGFKLYASINPAHFLTMSNPKGDDRGQTLTSCHSFNQTDYEYANGCIGYARDEVTFIVFTVSDPSDPETLNNRKTTRQIFAYEPGNGLLLQSRMYNTSGGTHGAQEESKLYRDLIQREISMLEGAVNLWNTYPSYCGDHEYDVCQGGGFGGYADWLYGDFDGKVSIRKDREDDYEQIAVGTYGLCIRCGCENDAGLCCGDCNLEKDVWSCADCETWAEEDERYTVYNSNGEEISVCARCLERYYTCCGECGEYYPDGSIHSATGSDGYPICVCGDCLAEHYTECAECGEYFHDDLIYTVTNQGREVGVCGHCRNTRYAECAKCGEYHPENTMYGVHVSDTDIRGVCEDCCEIYYNQCEDCGDWFSDDMLISVYQKDGSEEKVCRDCGKDYTICPHCGKLIEKCENGSCPACGAIIEEEKEEISA